MMSTEEYNKLHDELVEKILQYSNALIEQGVESVAWTFSNNTKVTIKNSKKSFKKLTGKKAIEEAHKIARQFK